MNEHLYRPSNPATSRIAAETIDPGKHTALKAAIISILREEPRTVAQVQETYSRLAADNGWPIVKPDSVDKRLSELGKEKAIVRTDETVESPWGRPVHVWAVAS